MEYAWVIEMPNPLDDGDGTLRMYWDGFEWSHEDADAVRFSRKVDAEKIMATIEPAYRRSDRMRAAEHAWTSIS